MTSTKIEKHYCDSGVFISFFNRETEKFEKAKSLFSAAEANYIELFTSTHTMAEVFYIKDEYYEKPLTDEEKEQAIKNLFNNDWITLIGFDRETAEISRHLCRKFRLSPFDSLHISTAIRKQVDYFDTFDERLENTIKNQSPNGVANFPPLYNKGVILQEPFINGWTGTLF